jgi:retron-type reverse transcriptase
MIRAWLKAGVVEHGRLHGTEDGVPQGGVVSPLLLNVALHGMEKAAGVRYQQTGDKAGNAVMGSPVLIRYADLCGDPHRSAYAESRVMPSGGGNPWLAAGIGWRCSA